MKVGIVGATGAVGKELVNVLADREFPLTTLELFSSARSAGRELDHPKFGKLVMQEFDFDKAAKCNVLFLAVSGSFALENAKKLAQVEGGPVVIDNSSALRLDADVPLLIPEINASALTGQKLIANPNCTTAVAALALWPLHQKYGLEKVIVSTYQAASGAGAEGMQELESGVREVLAQEGEDIWKRRAKNKVFQHSLAFNVIPHIDKFQENGYTREEMKVTWETRKIFDEAQLKVSCTAVRIPTFRAHAEAITVATKQPVDPAEARALLTSSPGVKVVDDLEKLEYPMPMNASGVYDVEVGRIRKSLVFDNGLDFFVCGDQLLRGAALNAVIIAELVVERNKQNGAKRQKVEA